MGLIDGSCQPPFVSMARDARISWRIGLAVSDALLGFDFTLLAWLTMVRDAKASWIRRFWRLAALPPHRDGRTRPAAATGVRKSLLPCPAVGSEEGIRPFLLADSAEWPVSGVNSQIIREGEDFLANPR
jgi:hypothetical protein